MKNNSILILLISVLGFGILCAIVASIAFAYYNGGFDSIGSSRNETSFGDFSSGDDPSGMNVGSIIDAVGNSMDGVGETMDYVYLAKMMQKFQVCQTNLALFQASAANLQGNSTILENETYIEEITTYLDDIESNCGTLGDNDDVPETYREMNKELAKSDEYISKFVKNYKDYFSYKKTKYLDDGNEAYDKAFDHLQKAYTLMEEALAQQTP